MWVSGRRLGRCLVQSFEGWRVLGALREPTWMKMELNEFFLLLSRLPFGFVGTWVMPGILTLPVSSDLYRLMKVFEHLRILFMNTPSRIKISLALKRDASTMIKIDKKIWLANKTSVKCEVTLEM